MKPTALTRQRHFSRRGASLAELLVVMTAASTILTMSAVLTHRMLHAQSRARGIADVERTARRLSDFLRTDIHQATSVTTNESEPSKRLFLRLSLPANQGIEYRQEEAAILRTLLAGESVLSRETFEFPPRLELSAKKNSSRLVSVSIQSRPGKLVNDDGHAEASSHAISVNLHVQAVLDRSSLFATDTSTKGGRP